MFNSAALRPEWSSACGPPSDWTLAQKTLPNLILACGQIWKQMPIGQQQSLSHNQEQRLWNQGLSRTPSLLIPHPPGCSSFPSWAHPDPVSRPSSTHQTHPRPQRGYLQDAGGWRSREAGRLVRATQAATASCPLGCQPFPALWCLCSTSSWKTIYLFMAAWPSQELLCVSWIGW